MSIGINAGDLTRRVRIVELVEARQSASGQAVRVPVTRWTVWSAVEALAGRELEQARQIVATVSHRVRIRWIGGPIGPAVTPRMQVHLGRRVLNIESVIDVEEAHVELQLMCTEVAERPG